MSKITKLGLGMVAFEGCEHAKNILSEIREYVDYILVCLQKVSYHGEPIEQYDIDEILMCQKAGLVDEIIWYDPDLSYLKQENFDPKTPRLLETEKRNMMIDALEKAGCSHDIIIDSDEFYDATQFKIAKDAFNKSDEMCVTYCQYMNYYRDYEHVMLWPFPSYVPFIADIRFRYVYEKGTFDRPSDPTRRYFVPNDDKCKQFHIFNWNIVHMHHLSWIRKSIEKKLDAWSSKKYFDNVPGLKQACLDRYINYKDGMNAIILFNVPYYQVCVNKLPKKYIHPKYRLDEKIKES